MAISKKQNILVLIAADHRQIEQLLAEVEAVENIKLYNYFNQIYKALNLHTQAEELVFYPAIQDYEETKKYIQAAEAEHEEIKVLLEQLKILRPTGAEFKTKMSALKKAVQHHLTEEESKILNSAQDYLNQEQLIQLGQAFEEAKVKLEEDIEVAMTT